VAPAGAAGVSTTAMRDESASTPSDLFQLHRIDSHVALDDQLGVLESLQHEGKIQHIGLSEVTLTQIEAARRFVSVVSIQTRYSPTDRGSRIGGNHRLLPTAEPRVHSLVPAGEWRTRKGRWNTVRDRHRSECNCAPSGTRVTPRHITKCAANPGDRLGTALRGERRLSGSQP